MAMPAQFLRTSEIDPKASAPVQVKTKETLQRAPHFQDPADEALIAAAETVTAIELGAT